MGGTSSSSEHLQYEVMQWSKKHSLRVDSEVATDNIAKISSFKSPLYLCTIFVRPVEVVKTDILHYFVTDREILMEFGNGRKIDGAAVSIRAFNVYPEQAINIEKSKELTEEIRKRMLDVSGASGYSFGLRNSEHLAKYIMTGSWVSMQMLPGGLIQKSLALSPMPSDVNQLVNKMPEELAQRNGEMPQLYSSCPKILEYLGRKEVLTEAEAENAFNVLVLGPTGCGKSNLINVCFNKVVCASSASAKSVTREMQIFQGKKTTGPHSTYVNIIDSIGFCDSELKPEDVLKQVKQHIKASFLHIDRVVLVCSGRLEAVQQDSMKQIMEWLDFKSCRYNFSLVYNKADLLEEVDRELVLAECSSLLGLNGIMLRLATGSKTASHYLLGTDPLVNVLPLAVAVGFPSNADYPQVKDDLIKLVDLMFCNWSKRIVVDPDKLCNIL